MVWTAFALHALFWSPFVIRGQFDKATGGQQAGPTAHADPRATALVWAHVGAFVLTYAGIAWGGFGGTPWPLPELLRWSGVPLMLGTTWAMVRVMMVFRSWRLRAALRADHQLCTEGPFAVVRHPIYTALDVVGVASLLMVPNGLTLGGLVLNVLVGDIRARAEERLLLAAFGDRYAAYMARTRRCIPGLY